MNKLRKKVIDFVLGTAGAGLVEYAVALIVVAIVGGFIFLLGGNIGAIIGISAASF